MSNEGNVMNVMRICICDLNAYEFVLDSSLAQAVDVKMSVYCRQSMSSRGMMNCCTRNFKYLTLTGSTLVVPALCIYQRQR